jgi:glycosyltransferase involved in cell wall biosynthesis
MWPGPGASYDLEEEVALVAMPDQEKNAPKVLFATFEHIPAPTGTACWASQVIKELAQHFDLDGLSLKSEDLSHIERYYGARLLRVPISAGPYLEQVKAFQRALNRQLDSEEYRLCHFSSIWEGMVLANRKRELGYKLIYQISSLPSVDFRVSHPAHAREVETSYSLRQQEDRCFASADKLLASSPLIREHLIRRGVPAKRISLLTPAIDATPYEGSTTDAGQPGTMLYLGSLKPWQGVSILLQALIELPRHIPARLLMVVQDDDMAVRELKAKIQMMGLARQVEVLDPVEEEQLPKLISPATICIAPLANHEHNRTAASIPHKVLVYMAARKAVVAAGQPVLHGLIDNGQTGLLYTPGDTRGLVEALKKLIHDKELSTQLGNRAQLHMQKRYGLQASLQVLRAIYNQLLGEASNRPITRAGDETQPSLVSASPAKPFSNEPETRPVPPAALPEASRFTEDTAPVIPSNGAATPAPASGIPEADTAPSRIQPVVGDLVFSSIGDEDTAPRPAPAEADNWQVMDAVDLQLENQPDSQASDAQVELEPDEGRSPSTKRRRYLLGGPSIDPNPSDEGSLDPHAATQRDATPLPDKEGPPPLPDKLVEAEQSEPTPVQPQPKPDLKG